MATMDVDDRWIPEDVFGECIARMPQVCVGVVLTHDDRVFLALAESDPSLHEYVREYIETYDLLG